MNKRIFIPGDEWLYFKIYTGVKTADLVLIDAIKPLVEDLMEKKFILKWFFIRYQDPKTHLRIRLRISESKYYTEILNQINILLQPFIDSGEISTLVIDSYQREIERYGCTTIEEAETLFQINSEFVLNFLDYNDEEKIITNIYFIDQILNLIDLNIFKKTDWISEFNNGFKIEFYADKNLNRQLDKKYRMIKQKLSSFLCNDEYLKERNEISLYIQRMKSTLVIITDLQKNISEEQKRSFFQSLFHMNINRHFISSQRVFEMIIYDYMVRYYKTLLFHSCSTEKQNQQ